MTIENKKHEPLAIDWNSYTKEELVDIIKMFSKNMMAMDGYWFQSIEKSEGMDLAMQHDRDIWHSFARTEALRIRYYLHLEEHPMMQ